MKKRLISYLIAVPTGLVFVLLVCWGRGIFHPENLQDVYKILCDGFFIVSFLTVCVCLLVWFANLGAFRPVQYLFHLLFVTHNWSRTKYKERETYADYVIEKTGQVKAYPFFLLWTGLGLFAVSLLFLILYYTV